MDSDQFSLPMEPFFMVAKEKEFFVCAENPGSRKEQWQSLIKRQTDQEGFGINRF